MEKLTFNTKKKQVSIKSYDILGTDLAQYENVHTVKPCDGYYEILTKDSSGKIAPVLRMPISNTIMFIEHE